MRFAYPANLEAEAGTCTVTFDNLPGATWGETRAEALAQAQDLLETALSTFVDDRQPLPPPPPAAGRPLVHVSPLVATKLALHEAMLAAGLSNVELARRMATSEKAIRRLRDPLHASRFQEVERALALLGRRIVLDFEAA